MREELMHIQRILDFNIMDKVMCLMPFTLEQSEGKLSSEMAKVRTIVENLEFVIDGTVEHIKIDSAKRNRQLVVFKVPINCRSLAKSLFQQLFLHKEGVIVQQYAPSIEKAQLGRTSLTEENNHQLLTEYVCYFIVDLFSGQVPKRRIKTNNTKNEPSAYEQCTSRVLSNYKYCEYCRCMTHTKYHCPMIKPCTNCGVKGHKTTSCKKAQLTTKVVIGKPDNKQYFPALPPKMVNKTMKDASPRKGSITKTTFSTKGDNTEKVITPTAQNDSPTLQESPPVTITGRREVTTKPPTATTAPRKTMTTGVSEMDTSKHNISSNHEASSRKKVNLSEQPSSPAKDPGSNLSPQLQ
ncbi:non-ltr retrotransposon zorro 3 orf1-related protein, putative [Candida dubliniensis CD36]|uniref:Non-ltr retrotransposon zorro 3 orf1-related protein, putative n=1 Tax=Candida dubliniensis (strain CD36 / ATCC MYA-646 / CBS 7987 / NCPF 3949 / NRRL Y-17841) TaxID=573826 RepID=B9WLI8_CANDC|nr:non-ltr retrotransposon zorro 3 orf1-related protein, putative [Candida dubliniensis CD36]CAX39950.1 non-ltr retrotransposon zorro 3 orf1-related protein, putative [Candida dubliniensis CD36]